MKLEINKLFKQFGTHFALSNINIDLPACQTVVIIGPSGGGKSTLLRVIAGLEIPDSGSITLDGTPIIFEEKALQAHRKSLGIVFQSWNLFPHLTALENIMLPLYRVHGLTTAEAYERSFSLLKRFDLDKHMHKKPFELSGGQEQRVALIRAVAIHPRLLLLDEPTSALDPLMSAEVLDLVVELKNEGRDLLLVTHQINFAKKIADQVLFVTEGTILEYGTVDQVINSPKKPLTQLFMSKMCTY